MKSFAITVSSAVLANAQEPFASCPVLECGDSSIAGTKIGPENNTNDYCYYHDRKPEKTMISTKIEGMLCYDKTVATMKTIPKFCPFKLGDEYMWIEEMLAGQIQETDRDGAQVASYAKDRSSTEHKRQVQSCKEVISQSQNLLPGRVCDKSS